MELEGLYSSPSSYDILEFYEQAASINNVVAFSRLRQRAILRMSTVEENRDASVAVIVPTRDATSRSARSVSAIFRPAKLYFVESSGKFFNYATSMNAGIREALKNNPEWIVISNDDVYEVDRFDSFMKALLAEKDADVVMASPGYIYNVWHHSIQFFIFLQKSTSFSQVVDIVTWKSKWPNILKIQNQFEIKLRALDDFPFRKDLKYPINLSLRRLVKIYGSKESFYNFGDFCAFRSGLFQKYKFDELYINGTEDIDLSLSLARNNVQIQISDFKIGSNVGKSLGISVNRYLRNILNDMVFSYKFLPYYS